MNFRRIILFTLPVLFSSSLALAQETTTSSSSDKTSSATKKTETKKNTKKQKSDAAKKAESTEAVSQTETTSAEQPPKDVAESRAEEVREIQGKRWSAAPLLGYSTARPKFGVGARAGYTFKTPIYVGGTFLYHFGDSSSSFNSAVGSVEADRSFYYPAAEAGYDFGMGPILVRPYGGVGILFEHTATTQGGATLSNTNSEMMIYPGVTAQYIFPSTPAFVGGDMRVMLPLEGSPASFAMFATAGITM